MLARIDISAPEEAGLAVAVVPAVPLAEGRAADLPRTTRGRTSLLPLLVPAADALPWSHITRRPTDAAAELSARLLLAFRSQAGGTGA